MKRLTSIETDEVQLEVIECDCGFHLGIDFSYLEQVDDFSMPCPACNTMIHTSKVINDDLPWIAYKIE